MSEELRITRGDRISVQKWAVSADANRLLSSWDIRADRAKQTDRQYAEGAKSLSKGGVERVTKETLILLIRDFQAGAEDTATVRLGTARADLPYRVRARTGGETRSYATFAAALASDHTADEVIEWDDGAECTALDVDFHGADAPPAADLLAFADTVTPRPSWQWITRSGGLRCVYRAGLSMPATALAGVAAYAVLMQFPACNPELLTRTRFPPGEARTGGEYQDESCDLVRRMQGEYTSADDEYGEWLSERGWEVGGRYAHSECPARPHPRAQANASPVVVHEDHVWCYVCAADGVTHGSHTPGYFPAARLCGAFTHSLFALCVKHLTHWNHARHVLQSIPHLSGRPTLARAIYHAAIVRAHGPGDARIPRVFVAGANLVRYDGHWGDDDGRPVSFKEDHPARLTSLPAAMYTTLDGPAINPELVEWLKHPGDISKYGYPPVVPIWGFHVSQHAEQDGWKVRTVVETQEMKATNMRDRRPKYLPPSARMPEADAWGAMQEVLPGLNGPLVELLIAAKGYSELGAGMPPMLFLTGVTGAGKTSTVQVAAAVCGDHVTTPDYSTSNDRLRAGILDAKKQGSYCCFDEYIKRVRAERKDPVTGMEALLNFTPHSTSHMLYVGPVALGTLPVLLWCDTGIPREIVEHAQLARRLAWVQLRSRLAWDKSLAAACIPGPDALRTHGAPSLLLALDSILSHVIDRRMTHPGLWADTVRALGFRMLEDVDVAKEKEAVVRAFFNAVCDAPAAVNTSLPGEGWKAINPNQTGALPDLWKILADPARASSRAVEETDIAAVCGLSCPARLDIRGDIQTLYVRFAADDGRVNRELELRADAARGNGRGDAVSGEHQDSRRQGIPAPPDDAAIVGGVPECPI